MTFCWTSYEYLVTVYIYTTFERKPKRAKLNGIEMRKTIEKTIKTNASESNREKGNTHDQYQLKDMPQLHSP